MKKLRKFVSWITFGRAGLYKDNFFNFFKFIFVQLGKSPFILIYQIGKTGSQTIEYTIRKAKPTALVLRTHVLQERENAKDMQKQMRYADQINKKLKKTTKKIHVITAVREPVGISLASIFQNHHKHFASIDAITTSKCLDAMLKRNNSNILDWFDIELKPTFGIDVFQQSFPHEKGFALFENEKINVLLYRFEKLYDIHSILEDFLNLKIPEIVNTNIGAEKDYKDIYQIVKKELVLPEDYLKKMYNSKFSQHFYTENERKAFMQHWSQARN